MFQGLFIDGFAGGGGASTGIAQAIGREVDIAINHSPAAIAIHKANHPETIHYCQDIKAIWPQEAVRHRPVAGAWFSPDCKEFSKAKGGAVKDRNIRTLAMEIPHWLRETQPEVAYVENVEEFEDWGPLEKGDDGKWRVIIDRKGEDFKKWLGLCRRAGYRVDYRQLRACDYGAPTSRKRLYIVMRRDRKPIVWPKPTHGKPDSAGVKSGKLLPYRTAAECIDWSLPCYSIFLTRDEVRAQKLRINRPLEDATLRRIAHGVMRYVVNAKRPFIVPFTHQGDVRVHSVDEPARTITGAHRGEFGVVDAQLAAHVTKFRGGAVGAEMDEPMPTVTANGQPARPAGATPLGMVGASLAPFVSYGQQGGANRPVDEPHHTIAASPKDTNAVVGASLIKMGNGEREGQDPRAIDPEAPLGTVTAKGSQFAVTEATLEKVSFIDQQYSRSPAADADKPMGAQTGHAKHGAVTAFLSTFNGSDRKNGGGNAGDPLKTARAGGNHHAVIAAHIEQANTGMVGHPAEKPLSTIVGKGCTQRIVETTMIEEGALPPEMMERATQVAAFLVKYYASDGDSEVAQIQEVDRPIDTITTKARFAVVTVTIDAVTYVIVDIGLRMLKPRELARAQGFPDNYVLNPVVRKFLRGKWVEQPLTIAEQISAIGNSVCPPVARALVAANQPGLVQQEERMAA